jgi:pyruvyl transferase EpsO
MQRIPSKGKVLYMSLKTSTLSSAIAIKQELIKSLAQIGEMQECFLLNYPDYPNIGDHLIGLGTIIYLAQQFNLKINYLSGIYNFSEEMIQQKIGNATILLQGGGNLGDLWCDHQQFREEIIQKYPNHRIIILPQTIYFQEDDNLQRAAKIFNNHRNLTIFVRDPRSYAVATKYFHNCQVFLSPDMAFMLADLPGMQYLGFNWRSSKILYHCRDDKEIVQELNSTILDLPQVVVQDWLPLEEKLLRSHITADSPWYWRLPGAVRIYRELWQEVLSHPLSWQAVESWKNNYPYENFFNTPEQAKMVETSWDYFHRSIYQLNHYSLVITNRLHGHILCTLLKIPHVFLPNSYGKNQLWYETWTKDVEFCRFASSPAMITQAIKELCPRFL